MKIVELGLITCKNLSNEFFYFTSFALNLGEPSSMMLLLSDPLQSLAFQIFFSLPICVPSAPGAKELCRVRARVWSGGWDLPPLGGLL